MSKKDMTKIGLIKVMHKTFAEFSANEVEKLCNDKGAIDAFHILANRLTKEKRQEIVNEILKEEKSKQKEGSV